MLITPPPFRNKIGKGYRLISIEESPNGGLLGHLQVNEKTNIYGPDIPLLQLFVKHETGNRLRVQITDAEKQRWEVPYNLLPREAPPSFRQTIGSRKYTHSHTLTGGAEYAGNELIFAYKPDPFSFSVKRRSNGETLFDEAAERCFSVRVGREHSAARDQAPAERSVHAVHHGYIGDQSERRSVWVPPSVHGLEEWRK